MTTRAGAATRPGLVAYIAALAGLAAVATVAAARPGYDPPGVPHLAAFVLLAGLLVAAEHLFVRFRIRGEVSTINLVEAVLAPLLFAWPAPHVVGAAAAAPIVVAVIRRNPPVKAAFNVAAWALAAAAGAGVVAAIAEDGRRPGSTPSFATLGAIALALAVVGIVNHAAFAGVMAIVRGLRPGRLVDELGSTLAVGWATGWVANALTGLLFVAAYAGHPATVILFPVPLVVLHLAYRSYAGARADRLRLAGLHRAARLLATPFDPSDAIAPYLREVADAFEAEGAELAVLRGDHVELHRFHRHAEPAHGTGRLRAGDAATLAGALVAHDSPVRVDVDHPLGPLLAAGGWRSCLAAPLVDGGDVLGSLLVLDQEGLEGFEEGEVVVLEAFARETAASLRKGGLVASVLEERQKLAEIVGSTSDAMLTVDAGGRVRTWNPACERITGLPADQVLGEPVPVELLEVRQDDGSPLDLGPVELGDELPDLLRITSTAGRDVKLACSYSLAHDGDDRVLVVVARDVTPAEEVARLREQVGELTAIEAARREVVERLQEALTPPPPVVAGIDMAVQFEASEPTSPTGGDLYDWQVLPGGELHLTVVDVLGHGVAATRDALAVVSALRILALQGCPLEEVIARADQVLAAGEREVVATVVIARLDPVTGRLRIASGGHPPAIVVSPSGAARQLAAPGCAIGWPEAGSLLVVDGALEPGDGLVLYTDGLVEARKDILEGLDVLVDAAASAPPAAGAADLAGRVMERCLEGADRRDDSLALVVRRAAPVATASWQVAPEPGAVAEVRRAAARWLREQGVDDDRLDDLQLVASELLTNAVRSARATVRCEARRIGPWATLEVVDDGDGSDLDGVAAARSDDDDEHGRGLPIVRALCDHVEVRRRGDATVALASIRVEPAPEVAPQRDLASEGVAPPA